MSYQNVRAYFEREGIADHITEHDSTADTVEHAARTVGCSPAEIAKSLSFMVDETPVLVVTAGDVKIDNRKYKEQFGTKAKMLKPDEAPERIGHAVGGVCPFAVKDGVKVYLDCSLRRFDTVFPACGSSNSAIELSMPEMEQYSGFIEWVDVCKNS